MKARTTPANRGASYGRFSCDLQSESSIDDQRRRCRQRAAADGVAIPPELEFADYAVSGTKRRRDGLDRMLAAAAQGRFGVLYLDNLSRLARESVITMPLLKQLVSNCRVRVVSIAEGLDTALPTWEFPAAMLSIMHETYIRDLRSGVLRGLEGVVLGGHSAGDYCLGYTSVPVAGSEAGRRGRDRKPLMAYAIEPDAAAWVVRIFAWYVDEGRTMNWIARELTRLGTPKDHRSTTPGWHHAQVRNVLANPKYIGLWTWGRRTNCRDPFDGKVHQEDRPREECAAYDREFPELRIVPDALWHGARDRLEACAAQYGAARRPDGKLAGGTAAARHGQPRHLLAGLLACGLCGTAYRTGGGNGRYLVCGGSATGRCGRRAGVHRGRAEAAILAEVAAAIRADPAWTAAILAEMEAAHRELTAGLPEKLAAVRRAGDEVARKMDQLVDRVEAGEPIPELAERLEARRAEARAIAIERQDLERAAAAVPRPASAAWVEQELGSMAAVLADAGPAAALVLRDLVGGRIVVGERPGPGGRRPAPRLEFAIAPAAIAARLAGATATGTAPAAARTGAATPGGDGDQVRRIVIVLGQPHAEDALADDVKRIVDAGGLLQDAARRLGINRNLAGRALAAWYTARGEQAPDGRALRADPGRRQPPKHERIAEDVMRLFRLRRTRRAIAAELGVDRNDVTKAIAYWHRAHGLDVPDGRLSPPGGVAPAGGRDRTVKDGQAATLRTASPVGGPARWGRPADAFP